MKVEYSLPAEGIEADVVILGTDGQPIDVKIGKIIIEPYFYSPGDMPSTLHVVTTTDDDEEIQRCRIVVSGATGKLRAEDHTNRVKPGFYRHKESSTKKPEKK